HAATVVLDGEELAADPAALVAAWQGRPVTTGDRLELPGDSRHEFTVTEVLPGPAGTIGPATRIVDAADRRPVREAKSPGRTVTSSPTPEEGVPTAPTADQALLAGLESQRELLAGWLTLLTSPADLPS